MPSDAVLVCRYCHRIFYRPVAKLLYGAVGKNYCSRACYLEHVSPLSGIRLFDCEEQDVLGKAYKSLARAILIRAARDLATPDLRRDAVIFLYSPEARALRDWSSS